MGLLWFVACSNNLTQNMISTMHGSLIAAIPMSESQFGLMISAYSCVFGVVSPFAGFLADRLSRRWVILGSILAWSAVTWATAYATSFPQLLGLRVLLALSQAVYIPAAGTLIADLHRGPTRPLAAGLHLTGFFVGAMLGGLGGWLAERHTWGYAFEVVGLVSLLYCVVLPFGLYDVPREGGSAVVGQGSVENARLALKSLFGHRSFLLMLACVTLADMVGGIFVGWLPTFMAEHFNLGQGVAGMSATGCLFGTSAIGLVIGGAWASRWSRTNPRACIYVSMIGLTLATPCMVIASHTTHFSVAIGGLLAFGSTASWFTANVLPILCLVTDSRYRATGYGLINAVGCFIGGVLVYVIGALRDLHFELGQIFIFGAACLALCVALLWPIRWRPVLEEVGAPSPTPDSAHATLPS